jgi:hypothetical protein
MKGALAIRESFFLVLMTGFVLTQALTAEAVERPNVLSEKVPNASND